jgi:hypothetical protein
MVLSNTNKKMNNAIPAALLVTSAGLAGPE